MSVYMQVLTGGFGKMGLTGGCEQGGVDGCGGQVGELCLKVLQSL